MHTTVPMHTTMPMHTTVPMLTHREALQPLDLETEVDRPRARLRVVICKTKKIKKPHK